MDSQDVARDELLIHRRSKMLGRLIATVGELCDECTSDEITHLGHALDHPDAGPRLRTSLFELADEQEAMLRIVRRRAWRIIQVGSRPRAADLLGDLRQGNNHIDPPVESLLGRICVVPERTKIRSVLVTVSELGFPDGTMLDEVYKTLERYDLHLGLCPDETAAQLVLQARRGWFNRRVTRLIVVSAPIPSSLDTSDVVRLFSVARDNGGLRLGCVCGDPDCCFLYGNDRLLLVRQ